MEKQIEMLVTEQGDGDRKLPVVVQNTNGTICIKPKGYGDFCRADGEGIPVLIEIFEGQLRIVVWSKINQEDHTHIIPLENARENNRVEET